MVEIAFGLLKRFWPYLVAAGIGFSVAWSIQGLRVESVENEFATYQNEQQRLKNEAEEAAAKQREAAAKDARTQLENLKNDHQIYKRCVAAGKCLPSWVPNLPGCAGLRLPAAGGIDAARANAVPAAGESAPPVILECAETTLRLNLLQNDIEKQVGYR